MYYTQTQCCWLTRWVVSKVFLYTTTIYIYNRSAANLSVLQAACLDASWAMVGWSTGESLLLLPLCLHLYIFSRSLWKLIPRLSYTVIFIICCGVPLKINYLFFWTVIFFPGRYCSFPGRGRSPAFRRMMKVQGRNTTLLPVWTREHKYQKNGDSTKEDKYPRLMMFFIHIWKYLGCDIMTRIVRFNWIKKEKNDVKS